jgi:hypothetical protein
VPSSQTSRFRIYPNPANSRFFLDQIPTEKGQTALVEIFSLLGEKVLSEKITGEIRHEFDFGAMPEGLYFVRISAGLHKETLKLVRAR